LSGVDRMLTHYQKKPLGKGSVTELCTGVDPPAAFRAVDHQRTRVQGTRNDVGDAAERSGVGGIPDDDRLQLLGGVADSELAVAVAAPTAGRTVAHQRAGVTEPRRDLDDNARRARPGGEVGAVQP